MICLGMHIGRRAPMAIDRDSIVYGRDVAERDMIVAFLRFSGFDDILLVQSVDAEEPVDGPHPDWLTAAIGGAVSPTVHLRRVHDLRIAGRNLDVAVWHDPNGELTSAAAMRARFGRRWFPLTATMHVTSYAGQLEHGYLILLLQRLRDCDALVCTSHAARAACERQLEILVERVAARLGRRLHIGLKLLVIPLGVDTTVFRPRNKLEARHHLAWSEQGRVVLWIGRVSSVDKSDLAPFLIAMAPVLGAPDLADLSVVIAGAGRSSELERLKWLVRTLGIAERVVFRSVDPAVRHLAYAAADIFVSPVDSQQETFGLTPIEAMATGVPQVVADWNGYRDTVEHGVTGFRVPTAVADLNGAVELAADLYEEMGLRDHQVWGQATVVDACAMAQKVGLLLREPTLYQQMSVASRDRAKQLYDWRVVVRQYQALWEELRMIAAQMEGTPSLLDDFTLPATSIAFHHYATTVIDGQTLVAPAASAPAALVADPGALLVQTDFLNPALLSDILAAVRDTTTPNATEEATHAVPMAAIEEALAGPNVELTWVRRHLLFLVKQGLIELRS